MTPRHDGPSHTIVPTTMPTERKKKSRGPMIQLTGPIAPLAKAFGSVKALAEALGVTPRSIQRWDEGSLSPAVPARKLMAILAAQHRVPVPYEF